MVEPWPNSACSTLEQVENNLQLSSSRDGRDDAVNGLASVVVEEAKGKEEVCPAELPVVVEKTSADKEVASANVLVSASSGGKNAKAMKRHRFIGHFGFWRHFRHKKKE
jgi:hypothetical protein